MKEVPKIDPCVTPNKVFSNELNSKFILVLFYDVINSFVPVLMPVN